MCNNLEVARFVLMRSVHMVDRNTHKINSASLVTEHFCDIWRVVLNKYTHTCITPMWNDIKIRRKVLQHVIRVFSVHQKKFHHLCDLKQYCHIHNNPHLNSILPTWYFIMIYFSTFLTSTPRCPKVTLPFSIFAWSSCAHLLVPCVSHSSGMSFSLMLSFWHLAIVRNMIEASIWIF